MWIQTSFEAPKDAVVRGVSDFTVPLVSSKQHYVLPHLSTSDCVSGLICPSKKRDTGYMAPFHSGQGSTSARQVSSDWNHGSRIRVNSSENGVGPDPVSQHASR